MGKFIDLTGQRFGRLIVVKRHEQNDKQNNPRWICKCDCGNETIVRTGSLRCKIPIESCGCKRIESCTKHGKATHPLYIKWTSMHQRCNGKDKLSKKNYKDRNISIYKEWQNDFLSFYNWAIENGWEEGLEIDRINNDGNYEPSNCRWVTKSEQNRNRRPWGRVPVKHVYMHKDKYRASINHTHIGLFDSLEEAQKAIKKYKKDNKIEN